MTNGEIFIVIISFFVVITTVWVCDYNVECISNDGVITKVEFGHICIKPKVVEL